MGLRRVITRILAAGTIVIATACGGAEGTSPTPPDPPPPPPPPTTPGAPATITAHAGDNQEAEPGSIAPVRPSVLVRDNAGRAVPGTPVTFSVDSGGGSIAVTTATTGADGVAAPSDWILGEAEGRNVLSARTGSLSPVRFTAMAKFRTAEVRTQTIGSTGGEITVETPGPLNGFELELPAGAFPTSVTVSVGYRSSLGVPIDTNVARIVSPVVSLTSDAGGVANEIFTVRIPARLQAGEVPTVLVVDSLGFVRVLATVAWDEQGVTAELASLAAQPEFGAIASARVAAATGSSEHKQELLVVKPTKPITQQNADALFRPGIDDWDFAREQTPPGPTAFGQVATADYVFRHKASGQKLWDRFDRAPGIPASNTLGLNWTAGFSALVDPMVQRHLATAATRRATSPALYDAAVQANLVMAMLLSGKPQVVVMVLPGNAARPVLAYKWAGSASLISTANPWHPGDAGRTVSLTSGGVDCGGPCFAVLGLNYFDKVLAADWSRVRNDIAAYPNAFPAAQARLGSGAVWTQYGSRRDTIFLVQDTARIWTEIPSWPNELPSPAPGATKAQLQLVYYDQSTGTWMPSNSGGSSSAHFLEAAFLRTPNVSPGVDIAMGIEARAVMPPVGDQAASLWAGFALFRIMKYNPTLTGTYGLLGEPTEVTVNNGGGPPLPGNYVYVLDWGDGQKHVASSLPDKLEHTYADHQGRTARLLIVHPVTRDTVAKTSLKLAALSVTPGEVDGKSDTDYQFTASYDKPTPPNPSWVWDLDDGRTVTTQVNTATLSWPADPVNLNRAHELKVTLKSGNAVVATGTAWVNIKTTLQRWTITSFTEIGFTNTLIAPPADLTWFEGGNYRATEKELRDSLLARPGGGVIEVYAPGKAPATWYHNANENVVLFSWLLALKEEAGSTTMYLRYKRGNTMIGGLLGATGSPVIIPPYGLGIPRNPFTWTNQFSQSPTSPTVYAGKGATKGMGILTANSALPSIVMMHLEINATATATGLAGTIAFVSTVICSEDSAFVTQHGCGNPIRGQIIRTYSFTAVQQ